MPLPTDDCKDQETPSFLPMKVSWFRRHIVSRLSWMLAGFAFVAAVSLLVLNQIPNLLTLHLWTAIKNILIGTLACLGLTILAIINVFVPSFGEYMARNLVFPAEAEEGEEQELKYTCYNKGHQTYCATSKLNTIEIANFTLSSDYSHKNGRSSVIFFCMNGSRFQGLHQSICKYQQAWDCDIRVFNYPVVTKGTPKDHAMVRAINAGIAQVYDVIKQKGLSITENATEISEQCKLYGHSLGGAIALQVAHYFKQKHKINLRVVADRSLKSFSAAIAGKLNWITGIPFWFGSWLARLFLYAGGDLDVDSMSAYRGLNHEYVDYFNLVYPAQSFLSSWGTAPVVDAAIHDDATLTAAIQEEQSCGPMTGARTLRRLRDQKSQHVLVAKTVDENANYHGRHLGKKIISYWKSSELAEQGKGEKLLDKKEEIDGITRVRMGLKLH